MARRRSGKKIDFVHWTLGSFTFQSQAAGTAAVNVNPAQHDPETLLRIRGEWSAFLGGPNSPGVVVSVAIGLILVPEGTGSTVLWSPITDGDAPWIFWDTAILGYEEMVADVIDVPAMTGVRRVIDNKAMRIVRNQELQAVVENATIGVAGNIDALGQFRVLSGT